MRSTPNLPLDLDLSLFWSAIALLSLSPLLILLH